MGKSSGIDIEKCMKALSKKRPVFYSESDFKFSLAQEIRDLYPKSQVILELPYESELPGEESKRRHLDILVNLGTQEIPIELKYKTGHLLCPGPDGAVHELKNHSAVDLGRYDCLKDVRRIECLSGKLSGFSKGYAVCLTNEPAYWKVPGKKVVANDAAFRIHEGATAKGRMRWQDETKPSVTKDRKDKIELKGAYPITWQTYSEVDADGKGLFKYAVVKVEAI